MKRILACILVITLFLSMVITANADVIERTEFSPWAIEYIEKAQSKNITENKDYTYINPVTREEFCEFIYNFLTVSGKEISGDTEVEFSDTENSKILALGSAGIIKGKGDKNFAPDDFLTREESAVILDRVQTKYFDFVHTLIYFIFDDNEEISPWAESSIQTICNLGFMKGTGDNMFSPKDTFTVEEALATLVRISEASENVVTENTELTFTDKINEMMPDDKNYMFSPISIKMALSMAANGADGETLDEIKTALDIGELTDYNNYVKELLSTYNQSEILKLNVSNSIWINKSNTEQSFSEDFKNILKDNYDATSDTVTNETAVNKINGWVKEKTNDRINGIINENNTDFWAMLVNAVYFKARWEKEFYKGATAPDTFCFKDGTEAEIDFMNQTGYFNYVNNDGIEIIELPYTNREEILDDAGNFQGMEILDNLNVSMFLIMGDNHYNPEQILNLTEFERKYIDLSMPKFKIEYATSLNEILKETGINKAFSGEAEFEKMFDSGNMWITDTIHKTYINVDEEGTEAAAVTGIGMAGSALPPEPIVVKYNKPFTFVIKDKAHNEILFIGEFSYNS